MARVFVSHAGADIQLARTIYRWLDDAGQSVFLDRDLRDGIAVGERWEQKLHERLRWADAMVSVVTPMYLKSTWCAAEIGAAQTRGSQILPLLVGSSAMHPLLQSIQYKNLTEDGEQARLWLLEALRRLTAGGGAGWPDDRSPFPGLQPFSTEDHLIFFGRHAETKGLAERLRSPSEQLEAAVLLIVGPSGCGKSSLARAGLLPAMARDPEWSTLPAMRPGVDPILELARQIAFAARKFGHDWTLTHVRSRLRQDGLVAVITEMLLASPALRPTRLLVVIDQFEEILTQTPPDERARFADLIVPALGPSVQVVGTVRPDFLDRILINLELSRVPKLTHSLSPLRSEALATVIKEPARIAGIEVEADLVERLVSDTRHGGALPLLAYTLARLAEGLGRGDALSHARYEQLGGVQGTLARQADIALKEATGSGKRDVAEVIRALLQFVTVDEEDRPTRWRIRQASLSPEVAETLESFVARRLVVIDVQNGNPTIEIAHEAFLESWPPLARAVQDNSRALRARRRIEQAAQEWDANKRESVRLWERGTLASAIADTGYSVDYRPTSTRRPQKKGPAVRFPRRFRWTTQLDNLHLTGIVEVSHIAHEFMQVSITRDRRRRYRSTAILAVLLLLAVAGIVAVTVQLQIATKQQRIATARQLVAEVDNLQGRDPQTALLLGEAAAHLYPSPETEAALTYTLLNGRVAALLPGHDAPIEDVAFSAHDNTLATASIDHTIILWDLTKPTEPRRIGQPLGGYTDIVRSVSFSPDGHILASGGDDNLVTLWDITDRDSPRRIGQPLAGHTAPINTVKFSPDGRTLATAGDDGTIILWETADRSKPRRIVGVATPHADVINSLAFSPDGRVLATGSDDKTTILWDTSDVVKPRPIGQPLTGNGSVLSVAFSPNGKILATGGDANIITLWDTSDLAKPQQIGQPLAGHTGGVSSVAFSPNGLRLVAASFDGTALLWDLRDPKQPRQIEGAFYGIGSLSSVAFSPDGQALVGAGNANSGVVWDPINRAQPRDIKQVLSAHLGRVTSLAFSPDGRTLATGSSDRTTVLWDLSNVFEPYRIGAPLTGHTDTVRSVAFSPNGRTLVTGSDDNTSILWDVTNSAVPRQIGTPLAGHTDKVYSVAFSPNGHILATSGADNTTVLWDVADIAEPRLVGQPLAGSSFAVFSQAFSPDGRTLATGGANGATLWDISTPNEAHQIAKPLSSQHSLVRVVAFSPDGSILITANSHGIIMWDVNNPADPHQIGQPLPSSGDVTSAAFSQDGRALAVGGYGDNITLWDLTDIVHARPLGEPLALHRMPVQSLAFSPDGTTLADGGDDAIVILWNLGPIYSIRDHSIERACAITGGGPRPEEWTRYIPGLKYEDACDAR